MLYLVYFLLKTTHNVKNTKIETALRIDTLVGMIFIFWLNWLHLGQFAYSDYESEIAFLLSRQDFSKSAI